MCVVCVHVCVCVCVCVWCVCACAHVRVECVTVRVECACTGDHTSNFVPVLHMKPSSVMMLMKGRLCLTPHS